MLTQEIPVVARRVLAAYDARTPDRIPPPTTDLASPEAYSLQDEVVRLREQRGEKVIGYKVGCTSRAVREQLGVAEPVFGRLFDSGCFPSGVYLAHASFANLAVEGELAVRLSRDLAGTAVSVEDCLGAMGALLPVIELHHHALPRGGSPGAWLVACNGMHAGFVLPEGEARGPLRSDLTYGLSIRINGETVAATGDLGLVAGPVRSLRWLAGRLAAFGRRLAKGQLVLTGSPLKLYPVSPGSRIVVDGLPLGKSCAEVGP